jgi:hypothetical protein
VRAEERRRLLGDEVIAHIHARVAEAPEPPPEVVDALRRILTHPAGLLEQGNDISDSS